MWPAHRTSTTTPMAPDEHPLAPSATRPAHSPPPPPPPHHRHLSHAREAAGHAMHAATHILVPPDADLHLSDSDTGADDSRAPSRASSGTAARRPTRRAQRSRRTPATNPLPAAEPALVYASRPETSSTRRPGPSPPTGGYVVATDADDLFVGPRHHPHRSHNDEHIVMPSAPSEDELGASTIASTDALHYKPSMGTVLMEAARVDSPDEATIAGGGEFAARRGLRGGGHERANEQSEKDARDKQDEEYWFDRAHGSSGHYVAEMGPDVPIKLAHLFKPPMIRQWVHGSHYYGEQSERAPSRGELFFDLVAAAMVHKVSDSLAEAPTRAIQVALFAITFFLAWTLWLDQRMLVNQSGSDDVMQRVYLVAMMILINAFISNASGVKIAVLGPEGGSEGAAEPAAGSGTAEEAVRLLARVALSPLRRAEGKGEEEVVPDKDAHMFGPYYFAEGWHTFLQGAMSFWLVARLLKIILLGGFAMKLPNFRAALLLQMLVTVVCTVCFLPMIFTHDPVVVMVLAVVGVLLDFFLRFGLTAFQKAVHKVAKRRQSRGYFPAQSVEHMAERMTLFTVLVIGETIMNSTYTSIYPDGGHAGWDTMFGRSSLTIINSFLLAWVYFDADGSRTFVHALRRHYHHALQFTNIHAPLCGGVIVLSSVIPRLIAHDKVDQGTLWYYSGGLAVALASIAIIACLHESLDLHGSAWFSTKSRILGRVLAATLFLCLPIKSSWRTVDYLGTHTAILLVLVAFETLSKIGAVDRVYDEDRAQALHAYQEAMDATRDPSKLHSHSFSQGGGSPSRPASGMFTSLSTSNLASLGVEPKLPAVPPRGAWAKLKFYAGRMRAKVDKEYLSPGPSKKQAWHNYEDLSYNEAGEEDVGNEVELGHVEPHKLRPSRRWALTAF